MNVYAVRVPDDGTGPDPDDPADDGVLLAWTYLPGVDSDSPLGVDVIVRELADGRFQLEWGDRVANSWAENYDDPAVAFARLAVLLRGARTGGFFRHQGTDDGVWEDPNGGAGPEAFVDDALRFLADQVELPAEES